MNLCSTDYHWIQIWVNKILWNIKAKQKSPAVFTSDHKLPSDSGHAIHISLFWLPVPENEAHNKVGISMLSCLPKSH